MTGGTLLGDPETLILGVASVEDAQEGDLVFAESPKFYAAALRSKASAALVSASLLEEGATPPKPVIAVENARHAFVSVLEALTPPLEFALGVHPSAQIAPDAVLGAGVRIGANVVVEPGARIADRVTLFPGVYVGRNAEIGADAILHPNVTIYHEVQIGARCILHAGCVIGADGFGYVPVGYGLRKVPQLGTVEIGDDVEMGACSCVDRSKTGVTRIGSGTKFDNFVHIAHNCTIGRSCAFAAQTAIAGGVTVGDGVLMGGQSGVADQLTIGAGARLVGRAGALSDIPAGATVSDFPARAHGKTLRQWAAVHHLPETLQRLRDLERRLEHLEKREANEA
jgi:UDP-3-O-[3-hydroxymyristoyl] glucosamine N-acyltransferase